MKQLESPFVIKYIDSFKDSNYSYILTEYAQGGDFATKLKDLMHSKRPLKLHQVMRYFSMLCLCLLTVHNKGFAHRGICPSNLLIKKSSNFHDYLIIGDVGFAMEKEAKDDSTTLL